MRLERISPIAKSRNSQTGLRRRSSAAASGMATESASCWLTVRRHDRNLRDSAFGGHGNVNPLYTPREILVVAKDSGMRALLTLDVLAPAVLSVLDQTQIEYLFITSLGEYSAAATETAMVGGTSRFADLLTEVLEPDLPRVEINTDEDVAVLQYTGGTTGVPKGAMLTHYNIFANVIQTDIRQPIDPPR